MGQIRPLRRPIEELVLSKGEPLFASFSMGPPREGPAVADLVVAPLADADGRVCGALVAREVRQARRIGAPSPHWRGDIGAPVLYSIGGADALAVTVATALGVKVAEHEERDFEDGEHKIRPLTSVRARDVYVLADKASMTNFARRCFSSRR